MHNLKNKNHPNVPLSCVWAMSETCQGHARGKSIESNNGTYIETDLVLNLSAQFYILIMRLISGTGLIIDVEIIGEKKLQKL